MSKSLVRNSNTNKNPFSSRRRGSTPGAKEGGAAQDSISRGLKHGGRAKGKRGARATTGQ